MSSFTYLPILSQNPNRSNSLFIRTRRRVLPLISSRFYCSCVRRSIMVALNIVAEYAKSNRSSCKKCSKTITVNTLRLGLVSRDSRGFDMTRWHHLSCFPTDSEQIVSAEKIKGFSILKSSDQEALKKLEAGRSQSLKEVSDGDEDGAEGSEGKSSKELKVKKAEAETDELKERSSKKSKVCKPDGAEMDGLDQGNSNESKLCTSGNEANLGIVFSLSGVKDKYKDATLLPKWKAFQTIIFLERDDGLHDSRKIAAFDFDGCLVKTSVKRIGADAWSLLYPSIPQKLQTLYNDGYKLVIFTNESNIERWKNKRQVAVDSKIGRLNKFIKHVKVPIQVFIACGLGSTGGQTEDPFRKPKPGMWRLMEQHFNSGIAIDMDQSFYVGDAAGRINDHSDADIKFAQVLGLKFYLPEEYFGL
ncbi:PREDICTED: polynucleotide 3'-phosphatase ZDP [Nelumbo nucifera]|uniref:PARP-type domain-containing protein n=2 Tax=Nelumbo nucifera TaxID=4432 RepID=A0A822ZDP4_NELNU|nr:PREDICTED: polynucleotide 3'-phosphatase ZDP [Nelumbo nucifera]DAD43242.1 TPA_asm: hypothetical protein HUJ06_001472 [Nelumbo nucifera]